MARRRLLGLVVVLLVGGATWLLWPGGGEAMGVPIEAPAAPRRGAPGATFRTAQGALAPTAVVRPGPRAPGPCVRGRVVSAATGAGVAGAQVVLATPAGALGTSTDAAGGFQLSPGSVRVEVAEVSAVGYLPFGPAWGRRSDGSLMERSVPRRRVER